MSTTIEKVNIYIIPSVGHGDASRLVVDRGVVTVTPGGGGDNGDATTIKAFERDSGKLVMTIAIPWIAEKTKNVVCQTNKPSYRKGQTSFRLSGPILVGQQFTRDVTLRMDLHDHRVFHKAIDPSSA